MFNELIRNLESLKQRHFSQRSNLSEENHTGAYREKNVQRSKSHKQGNPRFRAKKQNENTTRRSMKCGKCVVCEGEGGGWGDQYNSRCSPILNCRITVEKFLFE